MGSKKYIHNSMDEGKDEYDSYFKIANEQIEFYLDKILRHPCYNKSRKNTEYEKFLNSFSLL